MSIDGVKGMKKFLWYLAFALLAVVNFFALVYCFIEQNTFSGFVLIAVALFDNIFVKKCPCYIKF